MRSDHPGKPSETRTARRPGTAIALMLALSLAAFAAPGAAETASASGPAATLAMPADSGSTTAAPAAVEVVDIRAQAAFTASSPRVGDTLAYVLTVEWPETGVPVVLLAPDSLEFQGFKVTGQSTSHKKLAVPGADGVAASLANRTEFTWRLQATTPGGGRASSVKLRWLTGLSQDQENRFVPAAHLDVMPARVPLSGRLWFRLLVGWLGLAAAGALAYAAYRMTRRFAASAKAPGRVDLRPEALALKSRLKPASLGAPGASKALLLDMEALGIRWLAQELGDPPTVAGAPQPKFDPLLDRYLARQAPAVPAVGAAPASAASPATGISQGAGSAARGGGVGVAEAASAADWSALRDLFRHARFAGGHKEPHELHEAWRTLKRCLKITDEPGED